MDIESLRNFVREHPGGVRLRMVDGQVYDVPHRDYISLGPPRNSPEARRGPHATSFLVWRDDEFKLVNALLVAEVAPLNPNGNHPGPGGAGEVNGQ